MKKELGIHSTEVLGTASSTFQKKMKRNSEEHSRNNILDLTAKIMPIQRSVRAAPDSIMFLADPDLLAFDTWTLYGDQEPVVGG